MVLTGKYGMINIHSLFLLFMLINRFYLGVYLELNFLDDVLFWYLFILLAYV